MDSLEDNQPNWLREVVNKRSQEVYQKSMMSIFHRMRVVERLMLNDDEKADQPIEVEKLVEKATVVIEKENNNRQQNIHDFPHQQKYTNMSEWYEPFDLSQEVIFDGVNWYLKMKKYISGNDFLSSKYFEIFCRKLYQEGNPNSDVENKLSQKKNLSDSVLSLVSDNVYEVKPVGLKANQDSDSIQAVLNNSSQKGSASERKFIQGVTSLSSEFDMVYKSHIENGPKTLNS